MKKILDGKDNKPLWSDEFTCTGKGWDQNGKRPCNSLWEVTSDDIFYRDYTDYSGETERYYGFICPDCGCFSEIPTNKIPYDVKRFARSYLASINPESDI